MDIKERELVGNFNNANAKWNRSPVLVNDHDFCSDFLTVAIPDGIYDLLANSSSVFLGVSHDTFAFAAHSIADWWQREASLCYRHASQLFILAHTGGSNSCRRHARKPELQAQLLRSHCDGGLLSYGHFQMESH
jgi:hypothetical protein